MSGLPLAALLSLAVAPDLKLQLELGSELDTNVHRTTSEGSSAVTAAGGRAAARLAAQVHPTDKSLLRIGALAAGKLFGGEQASGASVGVIAGDARYDVAIARLAPGLRLAYYEAAEADGTVGQDFRTGSAAASLTLRTEDDHRLEGLAGYRVFVFKPNGAFDFTGALFGLSINRRLRLGDETDELAYAASYTLSERSYDGPALSNVCPDGAPVTLACLLVTTIPRADLFHDLSVELSYTRAFIVGARYGLQVNQSNSFGQSLVRHRVELSGTTELFWDLYLNAKVVVIVNLFLDALLLSGDVGTFTTIEDEARNAVIVHVTRDIGERLTIEARYSFFANPFAGGELSYRRQTAYLGMVVRLGAR